MIKIRRAELLNLLEHRYENPDKIEGYVVCLDHYLGKNFSKKIPAKKSGKSIEECLVTSDFIKEQLKEMKKEIEANKYYLSKKEGHEVSLKEAELDYVKNHSEGFGKGWRECYCNNVCEYREERKATSVRNTAIR